jgi:hypothetical protein
MGDFLKAGSRMDLRYLVRIKVGSKEGVLRDWQDREERVAVRDGNLSLDLSPWPVYLTRLGAAKLIELVR